MQAFDYYNPTHIVFGEGRVAELGEICKKIGKKVFFVTYDKEEMERIGLLDRVLAPMKEAGLEIAENYGIKSNPSMIYTRTLVEKAKEFQPDVLVAMGGGSVIDSCKCIAASVGSDQDIWVLIENPELITATIPLVTVCTIPATSSEMNNICVIDKDDEEIVKKVGIQSDLIYPKYSILDPELTTTISLRQTAYSSADICSHLLEGYISHEDEYVGMQNRYFDAMIKTQMECMERLLVNPFDVKTRGLMMWAATNSWNGFCVLGLGRYESMIHVFGHVLSEMFNIAHGATCAIYIPAVMGFNVEKRKARYARIGREIFGVDAEDDLCAARLAVVHMRAWLDHIGAPTSLKKANVPMECFDEIVERSYTNVVDYCCEDRYTREDVRKICELAIG